MSEPDIQADEASADGQVPGGEKSRPDWLQGEPDAERLVSYADNLRRERAELKDRLSQADVWDDEEKAFERVRERFPHWLEDDSEETDDDDDDLDEADDPRDAQLRELAERQKTHDEWIEEQRQFSAVRAFTADLDGLASAKQVELDDDDRALIYQKAEKIGQEAKAFDRKAVEKALDWLIARNERVEQRALERVKSSKRAPHVSTGGNAGKGPQPDLDTEEGRKAFYEQKLGAGQ